MAKKKEVKNSETDSEEKSEERVNFENALKAIFSLSPEQARAIRESEPDEEPEGSADRDS